MKFEVTPESGHHFTLDSGEESDGPSPVEALLASAAACSAMDVIMILEKKRQKVTSYHVEVVGERVTTGDYPHPFTHLTIKHVVTGEKLDTAAVEHAVRLSDEKYCTIIATLRACPKVESEFTVSEG